jgi:hypothetical protein
MQLTVSPERPAQFCIGLANKFPGCLFGYPTNGTTIGGPCLTSAACGDLSAALETGILNPSEGSTYDYCSADSGVFLGQNLAPCASCLMGLSDNSYLSNCTSLWSSYDARVHQATL